MTTDTSSPTTIATMSDLSEKWRNIAKSKTEHNGLVYLNMVREDGKEWRVCTPSRFLKFEEDNDLNLKKVLGSTQPVKAVPFLKLTPPKKIEVKIDEAVSNPAVEAAMKLEEV